MQNILKFIIPVYFRHPVYTHSRKCNVVNIYGYWMNNTRIAIFIRLHKTWFTICDSLVVVLGLLVRMLDVPLPFPRAVLPSGFILHQGTLIHAYEQLG